MICLELWGAVLKKNTGVAFLHALFLCFLCFLAVVRQDNYLFFFDGLFTLSSSNRLVPSIFLCLQPRVHAPCVAQYTRDTVQVQT